jgi:hypothetical protein
MSAVRDRRADPKPVLPLPLASCSLRRGRLSPPIQKELPHADHHPASADSRTGLNFHGRSELHQPRRRNAEEIGCWSGVAIHHAEMLPRQISMPRFGLATIVSRLAKYVVSIGSKHIPPLSAERIKASGTSGASMNP